MILFRKTRLRRVQKKIAQTKVMMDRCDQSPGVKGRLQAKLDDLTWKESKLIQAEDGWVPGKHFKVPDVLSKVDVESDRTKKIIEETKLINEEIAKLRAVRNLREACSDFEKECWEKGVDPRTVKLKMPQPNEGMVMVKLARLRGQYQATKKDCWSTIETFEDWLNYLEGKTH